MQAVTGLQHRDHHARRQIRPGLLRDRLVQMGIERSAQGFDGGYAEAAKDLEQLRPNQGHSLDHWAVFGLLLGCVQGPLQVIQNRQQCPGE